MTMTNKDLRDALSALSSDRLERLVDQLEADPELEVTVGSWFPQCPMVLAGFDGTSAPDNAPERHFAAVWDRFARRERRRWSQSPWLSRSAQREDVQLLLRTANAVLAARHDMRDRPAGQPDAPAIRHAPADMIGHHDRDDPARARTTVPAATKTTSPPVASPGRSAGICRDRGRLGSRP
jgi:hypothetical protein